MPIFEVLSRDKVVGTAELEHADQGMGVAFGRFFPTAEYETIRADVVRAAEARSRGQQDAGPALAVRTASGEQISAGFVIIDAFEMSDEPAITVQFGKRAEWDRHFSGG